MTLRGLFISVYGVADYMNAIDEIYTELKNGITHDRLKSLSVDIINRYKSKNYSSLMYYAALLGLDTATTSINRLFAQVIQSYHPDKMAAIVRGVDAAFAKGQLDELVYYKTVYLSDEPVRTRPLDDDVDYEEDYSYNDDDFGYGEASRSEDVMHDFEFDDLADEVSAGDEHSFYEAVNKLFLGSLDAALEPSDLHNLDGELDLSDFEIVDLKGVEHCVNISALNLSGNSLIKIHQIASLIRLESLFLAENQIESILALASLENLRELDLSDNAITDISVLLSLKNLVYVDISGNPVEDKGTISILESRGVIVIH